MKIHFKIECRTKFGQILRILVEGEPPKKLDYTSDFVWETTVLWQKPLLHYRFQLVDDFGNSLFEELQSRTLRVSPKLESLLVIDEVDMSKLTSIFQTTPFSEAIFAHSTEKPTPIEPEQICFEVLAPTVIPSQIVALTGNLPQLGEWNTALPLRCVGNGLWQLVLNKKDILQNVEYKFVICDFASKKILKWEQGENLRIDINGDCKYCSSQIVRSIFRDNFLFRGAGVAVPVFSLRSEESCGVGDFADLRLLVDWAAQTGQKMIQILPINDTTNTNTNADSYPYSANSVHALHPMYLRLEEVGKLYDKSLMEQFQQQKKCLNRKKFVDYQNVINFKIDYLRKIYAQNKNGVFSSAKFRSFYINNYKWLVPYAAFSILRERFKTSDFRCWKNFSIYSFDSAKSLVAQSKNEAEFYFFVQFFLDKQLREVRKYAHSKGVALKGDLPIGISANSVDAWKSPELFHLDQQAGAPPDDFSVKGQNWSFPTYNWEVMAKRRFLWWRSRFTAMAKYFDAYRIDHILGFFRIWQVPIDALWGLLGTFSPALPLTRSEIESYGIVFDEEKLTKPYITKEILAAYCGENYDWTAKYLDFRRSDHLQFKKTFDSQRKIEHFFVKNGLLPREKKKFEILMALHTEVLFIREKNSELFHPRINLFNAKCFDLLDKNVQNALCRLHDDFFYRRHNEFWKQQAMSKLPQLLQASKMLVCGEDLGMVPDCVPEVMRQLQILSLEIQRMPKEFGTEFVDPQQTPYLSVSSTGSHDMSTLRDWWKENPEKTQRYYNEMLHCEGKAPNDCSAEIVERIVAQQLNSNSMWTILPLQDYLALSDTLKLPNEAAERINDPSNPNNFWCYRMHISLEKLLKMTELNEKIKDLINQNRS